MTNKYPTMDECRELERLIISKDTVKISDLYTQRSSIYDNHETPPEDMPNTISQLLIPDAKQHLYAVKTKGDGNCLYNAAACAIRGGLSMSYRLRFLCAADMYLNPDLYSTSFETDDYFGMAISGPSENIFTSTKNRSAAVEHESLLTCETEPRPRWSSLIHIQALANVLKRSVISIYPDNTGFPYESLFNRAFVPLTTKPEHERPIYILWTVDGALPHSMFTPNHFVWLRESPFPQEPRVATNKKKGTKRNSGTLYDFNFVPMKKQVNSDTDNCHDNPQSECNIEQDKDESTETEDIEPPPSPQPSSVETGMDTESADGTNISSMPTETKTGARGLPDQNRPKNFAFPRRSFGQKKKEYRAFLGKWFDQFDWLHYDEGEDKAFCYSCMDANSRNLIGSRKIEQTFISEGYKNWKDAPSRFERHQQSECHREGVQRLKLAEDPQDIGSKISQKGNDDKAKARDALLKILSNIRFLARQGLPFRGAGDDTNSNFFQLNRLRVEDDTDFDNWLKKKQLKYDTPEIQNEMINIMAQEIIRDLSNQIRESKFFAILADETTDASNREQLVICLRWLDDKFNVHEDMVGFYQIDDTGAETIALSIKDALIRLNISISKCRGQTYDGASAMSGRKSGVQARIKEQQPKALYNHCHGHMINLVCAENIKTSKCVSDSLDTALEITKLVKKSPQRDTRLDKIRRSSAGEQGDSPGPNIRMLCPTRWTVRADAMDCILKNYENLMQLWNWSLEHVKDAKMKARIRGVQSHMKTFDFYFGLSLGECLLRNADNLSAAIQKRDISAAESHVLATKTVTTIAKIRTDVSFDLFWNTITKKSGNADVEGPKLPRQRKVPVRFETGEAEAEFHSEVKAYYRQIYFQSADHFVHAINDRYNSPDFKTYMQAEQLVMKCIKHQDFETELEDVTNFYGEDFHKENLRFQLRSLAATFQMPGKIEDLVLSDVVKFFKDLTSRERQWLSEVQTLLQLILVMPATNATSERSFSGLRRIKTYLRSTMKQDRLNSLMILHVQKGRIDQLRLKKIAKEFASRGQRASIFGKFD